MKLVEHIFLDIDGVIGDFYKQLLRIFDLPTDLKLEDHFFEKDPYDISWITGGNKEKLREEIYSHKNYFWEDIEPHEYAFDLYNGLKEIAPVIICTAPYPGNEFSSGGKQKWIEKHFPDAYFSIIKQKSLLAQPNRVLIDDHINNIEWWFKRCGLAIQLDAPWTQSDINWKMSVELLKKINYGNYECPECASKAVGVQGAMIRPDSTVCFSCPNDHIWFERINEND